MCRPCGTQLIFSRGPSTHVLGYNCDALRAVFGARPNPKERRPILIERAKIICGKLGSFGEGILAVAADERVADVSFDGDTLSVRLKDGRTISVPLAWYPRLFHATAEQRRNWKIAGGGYGIHWPELDEDISTEGLLRGAPTPNLQAKKRLSLKPASPTRADSCNIRGSVRNS